MSATDTAIKAHPELSIEPEPIIAPDDIHPAPAESWARGREFTVYKAPSRSHGGMHTVTYNDQTRTVYCTCTAAGFGVPCAHIKSVLFKRAYDLAWRMYADMSLPELEARHRDYIAVELGARVQARAWRAIVAALGDLIRERTMDGAA